MNLKTVINKTKMAAIASMVIFTMASAQSFAGIKEEGPAEFKYIGTTNDQPVFLLNLHNADADEFVITLKATSGEVLYSEKVSGKEIERKYRFTTDEIDNGGITVEVTSKKNKSKIVYAAKRQSHTIEDVVINQL